MKKIRLGLLLLFTIVVFTASAQGPWNKKQGEGFFKLGQMAIVSDKYYTPEGTRQTIKTAGVYITSIYAEYGLNDKFTAVGFIPFFVRNTINEQQFAISPNTEEGDESNTFGDVNIGVQYGLKQNGPFVLSASLLLGIPSGETNGGRTQILQSGDGEFNQLLKVHGGYSFYPAPFYLAGAVGFNNRTKDFSDEFHFTFEAGSSIGKSVFAALKFGLIESFNNGDATASQTGIFSNNLEYVTFGPEISVLLGKGFGVSASVFGALRGQNILGRPAYNLGLVYNLKK